MKQPQKEAEIEAWGEVPDLPTLTVGLDVPLNELKMMMFSDEVSMVVLTAPGGCGKTTLATKFCRDKKVQESYESLDEDILYVPNLHQITNRSLANLVVTRKDKLQGDGYYTEHFVTQHDLLRELGIYETKLDDTEQRERLIINISEDNFPKWWREQKYQCMKARLLSISTGSPSLSLQQMLKY
ncbi:hypothetical protein ACLB2K_003607 [Fragaria x ananassa]